MERTLVQLRPHDQYHYASLGRTALIVRRDGFFDGEEQCGLFVDKTRMLSRWRWLINRRQPQEVATSNVEQHSWLGYFIVGAHGQPQRSRSGDPAERTIELRLSRSIAGGMHEDVDVTNYSTIHVDMDLTLELAGDFADETELRTGRKQQGRLRSRYRSGELSFDYRARHAYRRQGHHGVAHLHRGLVVRVERADSVPKRTRSGLHFRVQLKPRASWHACVLCIPDIEGQRLEPILRCYAFGCEGDHRLQVRSAFLRRATRFSAPETGLAQRVQHVLEQARRDLASLRLDDFEGRIDSFAIAAGIPLFVGLFGRDSLIASDQASMLGPEILKGSLSAMRKLQGTRDDPWLDERPGRMLHQLSASPLAQLRYTPFARYYGSACTGAFFCRALYALWRWTGDEPLVRRMLPAAIDALRWTDRDLDADRDGFYEYQTRSEQGLRNQGWKDSDDAIVHADGSQAETPIGTCEIQAIIYAAHRELAALHDDLGDPTRARSLRRHAAGIRRRFLERLWMPKEGFVALGSDDRKRQIRSVTSNPGHCLEARILGRERARKVARRLMQPDLFSGWGVRTLSSDHPAYDPYSYHRGSVWPVEQGAFVAGLFRAGEPDLGCKLAKAIFEAALLFDYGRLPEVFGGQPRDPKHPFPALYPRANSPQAWSASTVFRILQALLGMEPDAPHGALHLRPQLPAWLPEFTVEDLRVGDARVTLRFFAPSKIEVVRLEGKVRIT
jgi:glycogen debranching enzyme